LPSMIALQFVVVVPHRAAPARSGDMF